MSDGMCDSSRGLGSGGNVKRIASGVGEARAAQFLAVMAVAALVVVGSHGRPAGAEDLAVSGSYTTTGSFLPYDGCSYFHLVTDGAGDWTVLGETTFALDYCVATGVDPRPVESGTFVITTSSGTLVGDVSGWTTSDGLPPTFEWPYQLMLGVTGGTDAFIGASGTIVLDGVYGVAASIGHGTASGTITVPPPTPEDLTDCMDGGWRDVADDAGAPFANLGRCVAWAETHR